MARELTYADHEYVNFRISPRLSDQIGPTANIGLEYEIDDSVLALDNDELGMVSWMNTSLTAAFSGFAEDFDSAGHAQVSAEVGANLSTNEYLGQRNVARDVTVVDGEGGVDNGIRVANDEPGIWTALNAAAGAGFQDSGTDGSKSYSGNGVPGRDRLRREFYAETLSGPYIDSTDNLNVGIYVDKDSADGELQIEVMGQMSFVIYEYDQRRAEFGPVPGGT